MDNSSGFVKMLATLRVQQEWQKPLFGKPFVKYGQCLVMGGYFFQLGGVLVIRFRDKLDEFGWAFHGLHGESGAIDRFYDEVMKLNYPRVSDCSSIHDYIRESEAKKLDFKGDALDILFNYGMQKIKPELAIQICQHYAVDGSALGAIHPDQFKRLFEGTHTKADDESWQRARASGLDIPEQQNVLRYDEAEQEAVEMFLAYCEQYASALYGSLSIG
jgi:hypothetical protein